MSTDLENFPNPTPQELRALAGSILLERLQWAKQAGLTFAGARDEYEVLGYDRTISSRQYREEYARGGIAGRIVDALPNATWRGTFELIEDEDPNHDTKFELAWKELDKKHQIQAKFNRVDKLAGLSTFAILLIGAKGDMAAELPKASKPEDLLYLTPYSGGGGTSTGVNRNNASNIIADADCTVYEIEDNPENERFGLPRSYNIKRTDITNPSFGRAVHWTRVVHLAENLLDDEVNGAPTLERVWNLLADLRKVTGGGAEAFWLRANQGLHLDIDKDMQLPDAQNAIDALKTQADEYRHQLTRWLRTRGVDVKTLGSDVANFESPADAILTQIAGARGIPKRILTGSEMGELASSQDRDNWRDQVNGRQTGYAGPHIVRPLVDRLIKYNYLPPPAKGPEAYEVRWPQIQVLTESEKTAGAQAWASTNSTQGEVVFTTEEIRDHWHQLPPLTEEQLAEIKRKKAEAMAEAQGAPGGPADPSTVIDQLLGDDEEEEDALRAAGGKGSGFFGHSGREGKRGGSDDDETPNAVPQHKQTDSALRSRGGHLTKNGASREARIPHVDAAAAQLTLGTIKAKLVEKGFVAGKGDTFAGPKGRATVKVDDQHNVTVSIEKDTDHPVIKGANAAAALTESRKQLPEEEAKALEEGYAAAQKEGFEGTLEDFYAEQIALYQHAPEGDKRLKTWFSATSLKTVLKDPAAKAYIDALVKKQKQPAKPDAKDAEKPKPELKLVKTEDKDKKPHASKPAKEKEDKPKGGGGKSKASTKETELQAVFDEMENEEAAALKTGFEKAKESGFKGTILDFLEETYQKYLTEDEDKSTAGTWLSGKTMTAVKKVLDKLRTAQDGEAYSFSSTQVQLPPEIAGKLLAFGAAIPEIDLHEQGREDDAHVTVKYGIHETNPDAVTGVFTGIPRVRLALGKTAYFETEDYDVLYVEVKSQDLVALNKHVSSLLEVTDTYPTYTPHATIAYLKKGAGEKYAGNSYFDGLYAEIGSVLFSPADAKTPILIPLDGRRTVFTAAEAEELENAETSAEDEEIIRALQHAIELGATEVIDAIAGKEARERMLGGPGSGFHHHAGRPGHEGGSAPSGIPPAGDETDVVVTGDRSEVEFARRALNDIPAGARADSTLKELHITDEVTEAAENYLAKNYGISHDEFMRQTQGKEIRSMADISRGAVIVDEDPEHLLGAYAHTLKESPEIFRRALTTDEKQDHLSLFATFFTSHVMQQWYSLTNPFTLFIEREPVQHLLTKWGLQ